jgi:hypothetical protein
LKKALQQPDKVKQALEKIGADGLMPTVEAIRSTLDQPMPLGYSNVGVVEDCGGTALWPIGWWPMAITPKWFACPKTCAPLFLIRWMTSLPRLLYWAPKKTRQFTLGSIKIDTQHPTTLRTQQLHG